MSAGPRTPIPAQPAGAPRFGLLASIPPTTDIPFANGWGTGISYTPEGCAPGTSFGDLCDPDDDFAHDPADRPAIVEWDPFMITVADQCSTFAGQLEDEERARMSRLITADTERQLGAELWNGTQAQSVTGSPNTWLADHADPAFSDLTGASPAGYIEAVSCLEQYLAENNHGQQGAIHATAQVVTAWESFRLVRREGNKTLTFKDTLVIASPGYPGDGGDYTDGIWAYATDMPRIFLGEPRVYVGNQSTDRRQNTAVGIAERPALIEWQRCRHAGIELDVDVCGLTS